MAAPSAGDEAYRTLPSPLAMRRRSSPAQAQTDSCCGCGWIFRLLGCCTEEETPRSAQVEAPGTQTFQPPTQPPSTVALRTYDEERDIERGRLLPKSMPSSSAPVTNENPPGHVPASEVGPRAPSISSQAPALAATSRTHRRSESRDSAGEKRWQQKAASADAFATKGALDVAGIMVTPAQDDDDDSNFCATCLEPYTDENPKMFTSCGHHFHLPCIYEWMERKDTCPMCGSKIDLPGLD